MEIYENDLLNYPYTIRTKYLYRKGRDPEKKILCEDICTFDIETTSFFFDIDKKPFLYHPGEDPMYWTGVYAGSLPYMWQFGINGNFYYGRDIKDFYELLNDFPKNMHVRIFVHNLSFEWHHLDRLTWTDVFAKTTHKPIKATCAEHPNIEFLCTLSLENRSLKSWGKSLGFPKFSGMIDYNQMYTPLTPLDQAHIDYGERDIAVMYKGLQEELKVYHSVWNLPLTSTGKTRRRVKELLFKDPDYIKYIKKLIPENPYQYRTSIRCFAGGYTHANRTFVNMTVYNDDGEHGGHYDYKSSYPKQLLNKFPCSQWAYMPKEIPDPATFEDHAYKMHLVFHGIRSELQNNYIPSSHCECVNPTVDNGRISAADVLDMWMTEDDYIVISQAYSWKSVDVLEVWEAKKDYLPFEFVDYVLTLFEKKTMLDGIPDMKLEYGLSKADINALFGMCCTALLQGDVVYDPETNEWSTKRITEALVKEHLEKLAGFRDRRYFLNYDWGVWCANGARRRLWNDLIIPYDKHVIYSDTDSIFTDIKIDFTDYNNSIKKELEDICKERGLDVNKTRPINPIIGKQAFLGILEEEKEQWTEFKTLGAKRYVERWKSDGQLHLTVAGINKEAVSCLKDDINEFKPGCVFDKDAEDVEKLLHTYVENMPDIVFPDGYVSHQRRGVNLRPNGYKLTMDSSFEDLLGSILVSNYSEQYENHLRSVWYDDLPFAEDSHYIAIH